MRGVFIFKMGEFMKKNSVIIIIVLMSMCGKVALAENYYTPGSSNILSRWVRHGGYFKEGDPSGRKFSPYDWDPSKRESTFGEELSYRSGVEVGAGETIDTLGTTALLGTAAYLGGRSLWNWYKGPLHHIKAKLKELQKKVTDLHNYITNHSRKISNSKMNTILENIKTHLKNIKLDTFHSEIEIQENEEKKINKK